VRDLPPSQCPLAFGKPLRSAGSAARQPVPNFRSIRRDHGWCGKQFASGIIVVSLLWLVANSNTRTNPVYGDPAEAKLSAETAIVDVLPCYRAGQRPVTE
jgi:hypothetical protein